MRGPTKLSNSMYRSAISFFHDPDSMALLPSLPCWTRARRAYLFVKKSLADRFAGTRHRHRLGRFGGISHLDKNLRKICQRIRPIGNHMTSYLRCFVSGRESFVVFCSLPTVRSDLLRQVGLIQTGNRVFPYRKIGFFGAIG